jgi:hypothetical protein
MAPLWPVKLIILLGCVAGSLQFLIQALNHFRRVALLGRTGGDKNGARP